MTDEDLRQKLEPYLVKKGQEADPLVEEFLQAVYYRAGMSMPSVLSHRQSRISAICYHITNPEASAGKVLVACRRTFAVVCSSLGRVALGGS